MVNFSPPFPQSCIRIRLDLFFAFKMKFLFIIISLFIVGHASNSLQSDDGGDETGDDYVVVEAFRPNKRPPGDKTSSSNSVKGKKTKSRSGRQFFLEYYPQPSEEIEYPDEFQNIVVTRPAQTGDMCTTPEGEEGSCVPMKKCYHFMYGNDLDGDGVYEGNLELANMIKESSTGTCRTDGPYKYADGGVVRVEQTAEDLVCCTGNFTKEQAALDLRVVGGRIPARGQYPYIVAMMNNGRHFCGGSLINGNHVLTAAHCVAHMTGNDIARMTIQLGDHNIYSNRDGYHEIRRVSRVTKHRYYNPRTLYNDVAILTLSQGIRYNNLIKPVGLSANVPAKGFGRVAGWGRLSEYGIFPADLHHAEVALMSNQDCKRAYGGFAPGGIADHMICAGSTRTDACSGDSGGPLLYNGQQVGIVSWGIGCGRFPGVYTRVGSFLGWIQRNQFR